MQTYKTVIYLQTFYGFCIIYTCSSRLLNKLNTLSLKRSSVDLICVEGGWKICRNFSKICLHKSFFKCSYWYATFLESFLPPQIGFCAAEDSEFQAPISAYQLCSYTWTPIDLEQFWPRNATPCFLFLS